MAYTGYMPTGGIIDWLLGRDQSLGVPIAEEISQLQIVSNINKKDGLRLIPDPAASGAVADAQTVLHHMGLDPVRAVLATPYLFWRPSTTDPASGAVIAMAAAIQKKLGEKGYPIDANGKILTGSKTEKSVMAVAGTSWKEQTWLSVMIACVNALPAKTVAQIVKNNTDRKERYENPGMGAFTGVAVVGAIAIGAYMLFGKGK